MIKKIDTYNEIRDVFLANDMPIMPNAKYTNSSLLKKGGNGYRKIGLVRFFLTHTYMWTIHPNENYQLCQNYQHKKKYIFLHL